MYNMAKHLPGVIFVSFISRFRHFLAELLFRIAKSADVKICYGGRIAFRDFSKETDPLKKPPYFMPLSEYEKLRTNDKSGKTDRMGDSSDD